MSSNNDLIKQLIFKYLSGEIPEDEKSRLLAWVEEKEETKAYYFQIRNIWQTAHPAFNPEKIDIRTARSAVLEKIRKPAWYITTFIYWQRIAAVLLIPLIILAVYFYSDKENVYVDETFQEIVSPYGTQSKVNLPDGSIVWLNGGSTLTFPVTFQPGKREVYLRGEGYFEVESDEKNPFSVSTERLTVRATGTIFNVEAYQADSLIAVTLVEGVVDVTIDNQESIDLFPGERLGFNIYTARCEVMRTDPYKWYAWKDGAMVFRDDPLEYVLKRIGKKYHVNFEIQDQELASFPYRAIFRQEPLDEILKLLTLSLPIDYRYADSKTEYGKQTIQIKKQQKNKE